MKSGYNKDIFYDNAFKGIFKGNQVLQFIINIYILKKEITFSGTS